MKKIAVLLFCLLLPACVAPPAITMASLALSGVSFMQTGKTLPDHALSSVAQQDCIMFRATRGEQICQTDMTPEGDGAIVVAVGPTDLDGTPWPDEITALPAPIEPAPTIDPVPVHPVQVASLAPIAPSAPVESTAERDPVALGDVTAVASFPGVAPPLAGAANPRPVDRTLPYDPSPTQATPNADARSDVVANPATPTHAEPPRAETARHLVIGSFRDRDRATAHIRRLGDRDLSVVSVTVKGRLQHRVVAGPYVASDLAAAKSDFAARGIKGAWPITLRKTPTGFQIAAR